MAPVRLDRATGSSPVPTRRVPASRVLALGSALWALASAPGPLSAQGAGGGAACSAHATSDSALANRYAPVLRFAPGERDFPVIPFFTAFQGARPFDDLDRITPVVDGEPRLVASWDRLHEAYRHAQVTMNGDSLRAAPGATVFYRIRDMPASSTGIFWRFLQKDPQAWRRNRMAERWPEARRASTDFKVVEYYFYYLDDRGLEGHREDIEFVYVFVPADPVAACQFRVTVGAGHDRRTPNNVRVDFERDTTARGRGVLVELGGHASSPHRGPNGAGHAAGFELGRDVNWHAYDVWGTRDLLALTGTGFMGPYRPEYTMSRPPSESLTLEPRTGTRGGYLLVPVAPFEALAEAIEDDPGDGTLVVPALGGVEDALRAAGGTFDAPDSLTAEQLERVRLWTRPILAGEERLGVEKRQIWKHDHYRSNPLLILKEHLYAPSLGSLEKVSSWGSLLTYGVDYYPNESIGAHVGVLIPTFWTPIDLPGFLEFQVGLLEIDDIEDWDESFDPTFTFSALYDYHYRERIGWYARVAYVHDRRDTVEEPNVSDWTASGGASLLLWSHGKRSYDSLRGIPNVLRVRLGPRVDLTRWNQFAERISFEILISFRQ